MALVPDKGKLVDTERNVNIPGLDRPSSAYDLGLYLELGTTAKAVLVVTTIGRLEYKDGSGKDLKWTSAEKTDFASRLRTALTETWSEKHQLRTVTPTSLSFDTIGVVFDIQLSKSLGRRDHSHWNITMTKVPPAGATSTTADPLFGGILNGRVEFDSEDLTPVDKGGPEKQRGAVHEFGHMVGYLDEYLNSEGEPEGVPSWTADKASVMNLGSTVQPRHYYWFAHWCNTKFAVLGSLSKKPIEWKVNGVVNKAVARI